MVFGFFSSLLCILFHNDRGLGGWEKWKNVLKLVWSHQPWVLCIQETKLENIDDFVPLCGVLLLLDSLLGNLLELRAVF